MSEEARHLAFRQQYARRKAFQAWLDAQLTPPSDVPAVTARAHVEPIRQLMKEGPDVGERQEIQPKGDQRFN